MKYYDSVPENFLLLRFIVTGFCNYRCPYCFVPEEKLSRKKTMFSQHSPDAWIEALEVFKDRHLELYFTGGEPTLVDDFIYFLNKIIKKDFVHSVRIDSNLARSERLLESVQSSKVKFLASFHPMYISMMEFIKKVEKLKEKDMLGIVNLVASRENMPLLEMPPHELVKFFEEKGYFLNIAKDFARGHRYGYKPVYREYIDKLQHPMDNQYMNYTNLHRGMLCGPGKHDILLDEDGNIHSCGNECHGNLFNDFRLRESLVECKYNGCACIVAYSFSSSNNFSPVEHLRDYAGRVREHRKGLSERHMEYLWNRMQTKDSMPRVPRFPSVRKMFLKLKKKIVSTKNYWFEMKETKPGNSKP